MKELKNLSIGIKNIIMLSNKSICAVVLAAGKGTRMHGNLPKVLYKLLDRPMIHYTADLLTKLKLPSHYVLGYEREKVKKSLSKYPRVKFVYQKEQHGTGHAVKVALKKIDQNKYHSLLVLHGDSSTFFKTKTIENLIKHHLKEQATVSVLTIFKEKSEGSGVILFDKQGKALKDIETKNKEYYFCMVNVGVFIYDINWLKTAMDKLMTMSHNDGEYYLTDLIEIASQENRKIITVPLKDPMEKIHINTKEQLKMANELAIRYFKKISNVNKTINAIRK
ncbi:hypothetical protein COY43_01200 [Candidatus Berkelbacteria bacterium CG_4_10_14_0_8_um_filter_35_9_33_8]|nr:MAG: hypothetical protein COY43_01200 [Candidatus Berkelbacteria bacterium CG_4_10_14_0_8_um_filter_35_9_33_8]